MSEDFRFLLGTGTCITYIIIMLLCHGEELDVAVELGVGLHVSAGEFERWGYMGYLIMERRGGARQVL